MTSLHRNGLDQLTEIIVDDENLQRKDDNIEPPKASVFSPLRETCGSANPKLPRE